MKNNSRAQVLAMVAVADGALLLASLWMRWAQVGFEESAGMLSSIKIDVTGWKVHDFLDIVVAIVALIAIGANASVAINGARFASGATSLFAGIAAGGVVAWTMIEPPIPDFFDAFNAIPGVPDLKFEPAYGLFVALAASIGLILTGILQMRAGSESDPAAATAGPPPAAAPPAQAPAPDPFAKTPPPAPAPPPDKPGDTFIDPVTGEPADR